MAKRGRKGGPGALSPDARARLLQAIRLGSSLKGAARRGGISEFTYHRWIRRGREAKSGAYREFFEEVEAARSDGELALLANIQKAGKRGDWRAAAFILERRWQMEYGRELKHKHANHDGTGPVEVQTTTDVTVSMTPQQIADEIAAARAELAALDDEGAEDES